MLEIQASYFRQMRQEECGAIKYVLYMRTRKFLQCDSQNCAEAKQSIIFESGCHRPIRLHIPVCDAVVMYTSSNFLDNYCAYNVLKVRWEFLQPFNTPRCDAIYPFWNLSRCIFFRFKNLSYYFLRNISRGVLNGWKFVYISHNGQLLIEWIC